MSSKTMFAIVAAGFVAVVLGCGSVPPSETPASEIARPTAHDVQVAASVDGRQSDIELGRDEIVELADDPEDEGRDEQEPPPEISVPITATPVPTILATEIDYLDEVIEPCTLWTVPEINPCQSRVQPYVDDPFIIAEYGPPLTLAEVFDESRRGEQGDHSMLPHIAFRGTGLPNTSRCDAFELVYHLHSSLAAKTLSADPRQNDQNFTACFIDVAVQEYIIGSGPAVATVMVHWKLTSPSSVGWNLELFGPQIDVVYAGYENLFLISHAPTSAVEALSVFFGYNVLIDDDGVVTGDRFLVDPRPLDAIVEEIKTVHAARIQRTGGRLGLDPSLPRLIDDVNLLRDFYVEAKAYEHPYVTPQPPPAPPQRPEIPPTREASPPTATPAPATATPLPETIQAAQDLHVSEYTFDVTQTLEAEVGWCAKDPRIDSLQISYGEQGVPADQWTRKGAIDHPPIFPSKALVVEAGKTYTFAVEVIAEGETVGRSEHTFTVPENVMDHVNQQNPTVHPCIGINTPVPSN